MQSVSDEAVSDEAVALRLQIEEVSGGAFVAFPR